VPEARAASRAGRVNFGGMFGGRCSGGGGLLNGQLHLIKPAWRRCGDALASLRVFRETRFCGIVRAEGL
jgi:hypothetical protein